MSQSPYIEDIFLDFYDAVMSFRVTIQHQDRTAASSFYTTISNGNALTKNQANYIIRILEKYKNTMLNLGIDYIEDIKNPQWAQPFRVIDMSRKVFVEQTEDKGINVCLKFPYQLLEAWDSELFNNIDDSINSIWDAERKLRIVNIYDANLIQIYDFCKKYDFEIDETFMIALSEVEEIWQNQDDILPYSTLDENLVTLKNASQETIDWFEKNKNGNITNDLILAKNMGFLLSKKPNSLEEKIAATGTNFFYCKNNLEKLLDICYNVDGEIAILIDNTEESINWIKNLVKINKMNKNIPLKICFRKSNEDENNFNDWIKKEELGGKIDMGKIFVFNSKLPKWLFKFENSVKIVISNFIIPPTNKITLEWMYSHPLVIFAGSFKPSEFRGRTIVDL